MARHFTWTEKQKRKLVKVMEVLKEFEEYKPLTLRQVFYQLVGKEYIENTRSQYNMLSNLLKWARIDGFVKWDDIEDRVRAYHSATGWNDREHFAGQELKYFLSGYRRELLQSQKKYIEIWIEKDALSSIFTRIAKPYCISVVVCRGFSSVSFLNDFKRRLGSYKSREPVMLYFGDFDPSGVEMLHSMEITLKEELQVKRIKFKRVALLKKDIFQYKLPHNPDALKRTDTRAKKHLKIYGELAVELDALRPDILEKKIKKAIELEVDMKAFGKEREIEKEELLYLKNLKKKIGENFLY